MLAAVPLATLVAYTAALLGCFIAVPQVARIVRTRAVEGISSASWEVTVWASTAWLSYGVRTDQGAQVLANVLVGAGGLSVLWLVLPSGRRRRARLARFAVVAAGVSAAVLLLPMSVVTVCLAGSGLASRVPQMRATATTWWTRQASGVSVGTWALAATVAALWLSAGVLGGDRAISWAAGLGLGTALLILLAETCPRRGGWVTLDDELEELVREVAVA